MCLKPKTPKQPAVVVRDPVAEAAEAANLSAAKSNAELANRRKSRRASSLLTMGAQGATGGAAANTLLARAFGASTLGG